MIQRNSLNANSFFAVIIAYLKPLNCSMKTLQAGRKQTKFPRILFKARAVKNEKLEYVAIKLREE